MNMLQRRQTEGVTGNSVPEELWVAVCNIVQEAEKKTISKKKKSRKAEWLFEEALQIAEERR